MSQCKIIAMPFVFWLKSHTVRLQDAAVKVE